MCVASPVLAMVPPWEVIILKPRSSRGLVSFVFAGLLVALAGCAERAAAPARVVSIASPDVSASVPAGTPHVPAGTRLSLHLNAPVGSDVSRHGDSFSATVTRAVYSARGDELVIPAGAQVIGRVVQAHGGPTPTLALQFETTETMRGVVPIRGLLLSAASTIIEAPRNHRTTGEPFSTDDPNVVAYSTTVSPWEPRGNEGTPPLERHVRVPAGAPMQLELEHPLVVDRS